MLIFVKVFFFFKFNNEVTALSFPVSSSFRDRPSSPPWWVWSRPPPRSRQTSALFPARPVSPRQCFFSLSTLGSLCLLSTNIVALPSWPVDLVLFSCPSLTELKWLPCQPAWLSYCSCDFWSLTIEINVSLTVCTSSLWASSWVLLVTYSQSW
jgi:hypothetical protein